MKTSEKKSILLCLLVGYSTQKRSLKGHDTTSTSIGWTIWCLAHNPNWQKRVQKELDDIFGNSDRDITSEDLTNLKELERCIKEGLRLRPTVPYFLRDVDQDFEISKIVNDRFTKFCRRTYNSKRLFYCCMPLHDPY